MWSSPLNDWLLREAHRAQRSDTARSYVWIEEGSLVVVDHYAITPTEVLKTELPRSLTGGMSVVPGYLLGRLALDRSLHGAGLGNWLLYDALETAVNASEVAGGRIIVVDAIDDHATAFYMHHGFRAIKGNPRRLVLKMATARALLDETAPKPRETS
ncbi:GNAT family N-acetyltransferase [Actinoallomurus sp. NPDC052274]|uniref:GNAT family N-acetyltransferase n=1 Tax=Actinoallomurus sp. NPDC052274 TaxID=3155420 RepID=UPI00344A1FD8